MYAPMPKQDPAYINVCAKYHNTELSMWYEDKKKDKKDKTIPLASVVSAEMTIIFSLMSFFITHYINLIRKPYVSR
jgi:hypothetical protein